MDNANQFRKLESFPALAHFISEDSDAAIFRAFSELGARNLLYPQSNVNELEIQLKRLDHEDWENSPGNPGLRIAAREYRSLKAAAAERGSQASHPAQHNLDGENGRRLQSQYFQDRVELHTKLKGAMREYREALIQEQQIRTMKRPPKPSIANFTQYFCRKDGNILLGDDENLLENPSDLVALSPSEDDRLNSFLRYTCGYCFKDRERKPPPGVDIFYYSDRAIHLTGHIIAAILSGILLLGAMACLSLVYNRSWHLRLGMVALFTALFAVVVGLLTSARRAEVFGATVAYAAVLVVYVSGSLGPPNAGNGG